MQAIKNGLKCTIRTPAKTLLFTLILTVTAALLTVSFCVYYAVRNYLDDCDAYFHTIAELEYMGSAYPDSNVYDEGLVRALEDHRDVLEALIADDGVLSFEPGSSEFAVSEKIHRWDNLVPEPDMGVLRISLYNYNEKIGTYNAIVSETLYSRSDYTDKLIMFRTLEGNDSLDCPGSYLVAGQFYAGRLQNPSFGQEIISFPDNGTLTELPRQLEKGGDAEKEALFRRYAKTLHLKNDACRVSYTAAVEDLYPFHQQVLHLTSGRYFTQEEYETRAHVCIISERIAGMLGLGVGDSIPFEILHADGDPWDLANLSPADSGDYEIIGVHNHDESYPYWVFLPDSAAASTGLHPVSGYHIGQFRLRNDAVAEFLIQAEPLTQAGFRLDVYDQGYAAATEPMQELLLISSVFLAVCLLLAVCAMALQSYIFISRQRETARTMHALGSGRTHVCIYYLSAALAQAVIAAVCGALIGKQAEGKVFSILKEFATQFAGQDLRFSTSRLAIVRSLDFNPATLLQAYLAAGTVLLAGVVLFALAFSAGSLRKKIPKKRRTVRPRIRIRKPGNSRMSGYFKYAMLSIRRGSVRTQAVLLMGVAAAVFFGNLTSSLNGYQVQLDAYRRNAVITGSATDQHGKQISNLVLKSDSIADLASGDLIDNCTVTINMGHIKYLGVVGKEQIPFTWAEWGSYVYESTFYWMNKGPLLIGTSSVSDSPVFHYSESGSVEWLEGFGEADFIGLEEKEGTVTSLYGDFDRRVKYNGGPSICALPKSMMEENGIRLGDEINTVIAYYHPQWDMLLVPMQFKVVASYVAPRSTTTVYVPVTFVRPELEAKQYFHIIQDPEADEFRINGRNLSAAELSAYQSIGLSPALNYSSFTFTLKDAALLEELRSAMAESGYTWVHSGQRNKNFAMIEDEIYLSTVHSMERQIQYVTVLYHALYLLTGVIGFVLAWLLLQSRRREIAVMRALGTQKLRLVVNFFTEQLLLMTVGLGLGLLLCRLTGVGISRSQLLLTAAFLAVWCMSTLLCLLVSIKKRSYAALTEPE